MNIMKSAGYIACGLYLLFFSAACVCAPPPDVDGQQQTQAQTPAPSQQAEAPADAHQADGEVMFDESSAGSVSVDEVYGGGEAVMDDAAVSGEVYEDSYTESASTEVYGGGEVMDDVAVSGEVYEDSYTESASTEVYGGGEAVMDDAAVSGEVYESGYADSASDAVSGEVYSGEAVMDDAAAGGEVSAEGSYMEPASGEGEAAGMDDSATVVGEGPAVEDGAPVMME